MQNISIIGASGAIGNALLRKLSDDYPSASLHSFSRNNINVDIPNLQHHCIHFDDETSIKNAANIASSQAPIDLAIIATGVLHTEEIKPEKALRELSAINLEYLFKVNTIYPAVIAKHFIPRMNSANNGVFAVLSARAGSIADNEMGGWYAYRASKAALNMLIKNISIESSRKQKGSIVVSLDPGVVDSKLSRPFHAFLPEGKLLSPETSAEKLIALIQGLTSNETGKLLTIEGEEVAP